MLLDDGRLEEAEPYLKATMEITGRIKGTEDPEIMISAINLSFLLTAQKKYGDAVELLEPLETMVRSADDGNNGDIVAKLLVAIGTAETGLKDFAAAETRLTEAQGLYELNLDFQVSDKIRCLKSLVGLYSAWDAEQPGAGHDAKASTWQATLESSETTANSSAK